MFSPKLRGKWQWRLLIRRAFKKFKNQERYLFTTTKFYLVTQSFQGAFLGKPE
jgi:hypothetical protein